MLEIKDLYASIEGKQILKGINLQIKPGEIHVLMGMNGAGKSCLANVLAGNPKYKLDSGEIILNGKTITESSPDEKSKLGMFMSFQNPIEISGVTIINFLRTALNEKRKSQNLPELSVIEFYGLLKEKMSQLEIPSEFSRRYLNEGFSGGEKKRSEILQMLVLNPEYIILDECDSGLDVSALKTIGETINKVHSKDKAILIITHYNRILNYLNVDQVSIMSEGKIIKTGTKELANKIERDGFKNIISGSIQ